jgi:hypothetical protein
MVLVTLRAHAPIFRRSLERAMPTRQHPPCVRHRRKRSGQVRDRARGQTRLRTMRVQAPIFVATGMMRSLLAMTPTRGRRLRRTLYPSPSIPDNLCHRLVATFRRTLIHGPS